MHSAALALRLPSRGHHDMTDIPESKGDRIIESVEFFLRALNPNEVILGVAALMALFALVDAVTFAGNFQKFPHRDLKTSIVSLGILGTFIGITIGLVQFDTKDVTGSTPVLLSGLKVAFYTSVWGMLLSVVLAVLQRLARPNAGRDNADQLDRIADLIAKRSDASHGELKKLNAGVETLRNELKATRRRTSFLSKSLARVEPKLLHRLDGIESTIKDALDRIARTASTEIVEELRKIVREFNENIQEQFGESLRQFSKACERLLEWQEQHKEEIDELHRQLQCVGTEMGRATVVLDQSAEKTRAVLKVCERIETVVSALGDQTQTTTDRLNEYASVTKEIEKTLAEVTQGINDSRNSITNLVAESQKQLQEQNKKQKEIFDSLKEIARKIEEISTEVETHKNKIQAKLSEQTDGVVDMMKGTVSQLKGGLEEMESVFIRVTKQLGKSYEEHLKYLRTQMPVFHECLQKMQETLREMQQKTREMKEKSSE